RNALQRQIENLGLGDRVRLRGQQPNASLPEWYRAADLVVLSSDSEGIPNVLVEAAACGTPFVATAVGGIPEILNFASGAVVPAGDSAALAQAIMAFAKDPSRSHGALSRDGIPSVPDAVESMLQLFSGIIEERHVPSFGGTPVSH